LFDNIANRPCLWPDDVSLSDVWKSEGGPQMRSSRHAASSASPLLPFDTRGHAHKQYNASILDYGGKKCAEEGGPDGIFPSIWSVRLKSVM
jgi:hypothetical protein